jgi:tyrosyl-tRNA synthetase
MAPHNILPELRLRGLVADVTGPDELGALMAQGSVPHYTGHDPTATSLHVGHLVPLIVQRRLQLAGHRPIVIIGGATGMIGDPSGKSNERQLLDQDTLASNMAGMRVQFGRFLDFAPGPAAALLTDNGEWFRPMGFLDFLRDVGKHITVNYMLAKDSVKSRIDDREQGISYTEFSYMLLQAWDFVHLSRAHGCRLQIGGSDQWGNITAGIELSRKLGGAQLFGLTAPLLLDSGGQKMGKTSTGQRVWLDETRTSAYALSQYWLNTTDEEAVRCLRMFSFRDLGEIDAICRDHDLDRGKRLAQRTLAEDLTTWIHGAAGHRRAQTATEIMFGGSLANVGDAELEPLIAEVGCIEVSAAELAAGIPFLELLVRADLASSKGEARRLVGQGGVYINNERCTEVDLRLGNAQRGTQSFIFLRSGKKKYRLVKIVS